MAASVLLFFVGTYNYLLFHSLVEVVTIVVAGLIFLITLSARKILDNNFVLIMGAAYLSIGIFDLLHTFSYSGLNVFPGADANLPTQLWLAARYTESLSIFAGLFLINYKFKFHNIFLVYYFFTAFVLLTIFYWQFFPTTYINGQGLTGFKIYSEYFITIILIVSLFALYSQRKKFNNSIYLFLTYSIAFTMLAEIVFTLYFSVISSWSMLGHFFKLISFYYIYRAVAEIGIIEPHKVLYNNLKKNEQKYQTLFSHMNEGFALHKLLQDKSGKAHDYEFVEVNDAFCRITGLKKKEILGRRVTEAIPGIEKDPADWIGKYGKLVNDKTTLKFEQYSEALKKWYSISAYSPQPGYFAVIVDDITEQKNIEKEIRSYTENLEDLTNELFKFQLAVEDASEAIIITDSLGTIIYANRATENITGFSDKEIVGHNSRQWGNILPPDTRYCDCPGSCIWECLPYRGNRYKGEVLNRRKDGTEFYSYLTVSPIHNEGKEIIFYVCIERDITKIKEADKAKSDFIYFVSHELKTPLASIQLSVDLLSKGATGIIPEGQVEYLDIIRSCNQEMSDFISSLLNISRIESDSVFLDSEPLDAGIEINKLLNDLKMEIRSKDLIVEREIDSPLPIIVMDEKLFHLIIRNLLTNAVRYTPEKGLITVSAYKNGAYLEICVADTGIGIPKKDQDKIFNKMFRSSNSGINQAKGSGLGLYIAKNMADKVGAKISFESREGQGTKFFVRFPLPENG